MSSNFNDVAAAKQPSVRVQQLMRVWLKVSWFFRQRYVYFLSFLLPALILFVSYILFEVYPFGERSVLSLDLNAQYVYYYDYMYDVFAGDESIFYSWSRNLSGEFAGIIGYYLASPFNLIVWLFPRKFITEGLMVMMLAKAGSSGLACSFYLKKHRGFSNQTSLLFSVMWALCGYFVVQTMNPMWLDGLVALPLVIMGVESVCDKRRFAIYVVSLVYIFVANFYIGYMVGIFSAIYFLYYLASGRSEKNNHIAHVCVSVIVYAAASVSAILMSMWMILPVYKSLSNGKLEFTDNVYEKELADTFIENFDIADIFIKLFPTSYDTVRMEGMPMLYCGTLALVFAVVYFITNRVTVRERISMGFIIGVMVLCMYVRPIDMIWHGGQMPNWLPYRYSFVISFLLLMAGAEAFDKCESILPKHIGMAFAGLAAVLLFADKNNDSEYYDAILTVAIPLLTLAVICTLAYAFRKYKKHIAMAVTLAVVVCLECFMNTYVSLRDMHSDIVFSNRSTYRWDIPYTREVTEQIHSLDDGFYRMEKTYHRCVNDPIALRMYGMSHSSSTLNAKAISLLKTLGYTSREHYTRYDGNTMLTDDIFGVKYILAKDAKTLPYTDTVPVTVKNDAGITAYKNEDALGFAYLADSEIAGYSFDEPHSPFAAQNSLAKVLSGDKPLTVFKPVADMEFDSENIRSGTTTDAHFSYRKIKEDNEAWISYTITAEADAPIYMYLPTIYERGCELYIDGEYRFNYYQYENFSIEYLGTYNKGDTFEVKLKLLDDAVYFSATQFYYVDTEELDKFNERMQRMNEDTVLERTGGCRLELSVNADEDQVLFTTIPAEEGWTVLIDGKETEWTTTLEDSLLCVPVTQGEHDIVLEFVPAGLKVGIIFSISGVLTFVIMILVSVMNKRRMAAEQQSEQENED